MTHEITCEKNGVYEYYVDLFYSRKINFDLKLTSYIYYSNSKDSKIKMYFICYFNWYINAFL